MEASMPELSTVARSRRDFLSGVAGLAAVPAIGRVAAANADTQARGTPMPHVTMLVFDTFGTVVDWRGTIVAEGAELSRRKGLQVDWAAFADAWRAEYGPSMGRVRRGELPWTNLDGLHRMSLEKLLPKFGLTGLSEAETTALLHVWHRCRPWPDSVEGLTRLRTKHVIAPLSNGNISLLTNMAKRGGLPWDCILGAELVQRYKPDPEVYLSPAKLFGLEVAQVMMVAAHTPDLAVPKKLGLRTAYIHRPYEGGTSSGNALPAPGSYDFIVKDLRELASALRV
jgi:2-haloacid dehalogenase